jgi:predicted flap endonuclease-1-like 5' DNA nuclease
MRAIRERDTIMLHSEHKQGPRFEIWAMAVAVAVVAAAVAIVVGGFSYTQAGFVGAALAAVMILAFGFPRSERTLGPVADEHPAAATAAVVAAPLMAAPVGVAPVEVAPVAVAPVNAAPVKAVPVMAAVPEAAAKPAGLTAARGGKADDLKIIKGIGPKLEILCHKLGFYHFDQVANWKVSEVAWVDENLEGFKGRVTRDRWQPQAKAIVEMGPEEFLRQLDAGHEF